MIMFCTVNKHAFVDSTNDAQYTLYICLYIANEPLTRLDEGRIESFSIWFSYISSDMCLYFLHSYGVYFIFTHSSYC